MAVHGILFLRVLDPTHDLAPDLDYERAGRLYEFPAELVWLEAAPPRRDLRLAADVRQPGDILFPARPQQPPLTS